MKSWTYNFENQFSQGEIEGLVEYGLSLPMSEGTIGHGGGQVVDKGFRNSKVSWIKRNREVRWLFDRINLLALEANEECFYLDLGKRSGLTFSSFQFTEYNSNGQHYDWHTDNCWTPKNWTAQDRKLSCVIQLTEPGKYKGGKLELDGVEISKGKFETPGSVLFFPSHLKHRVTDVTEGTRHSLVTWIEGPRLR